MTRFSRWSQRKRGLEPVDETAPAPTPLSNEIDKTSYEMSSDNKATDSEPIPTAANEKTPLQEPADELPDPDTLPPGSDLTAYLAHGVGRELRRKALKRLFAADHYHHRDGLNDYDDDYRKLKTLSQEVADRLRQWTRHLDDDEGTNHQAPGQTDTTVPTDPSRDDTQNARGSEDAPDSEHAAGRISEDLGGQAHQQDAEDPQPINNS